MTGNPRKFSAESNSKTIGRFNPISKTTDTITNFCWCLFFILFAMKALSHKVFLTNFR